MEHTFGRFYVDLRSIRAESLLVEQLAEHGLATFDGVRTREAVLSIASDVATIRPHRDSEPDGVTVLAGTDRVRQRPGYEGFGRGELFPHTDGTSLRQPPGIVALACVQPSHDGGECLLADGREIYGALVSSAPATARALSTPNCASFGDRSPYLGAVFEPRAPGRFAIRFRYDNLVRFTPAAAGAVPAMLDMIRERTLRFRLQAGQGYIAQNGRWLHGRTTFAGQRVMYRVLGDPRSWTELGRSIAFGFTPVTVGSLAQT